jgi:lysine-specific demethylase 8
VTLAQRLGPSELSVEVGPKLENRRHDTAQMTIKEFLRATANDTDESSHYIVTPLDAPGASALVPELLLPSVLRCGGATEEPMRLHLWVSAGGTRSVLHSDPLDNLNCVFSGRKRFWMVDSVHNASFQRDTCGWTVSDLLARANGDDMAALGANELRKRYGYGAFAGNLDVRSIDLDSPKGACWAELPWWEADVGPGDCLYIPTGFLHHVYTPPGHSVAVNWWYHRPHQFDSEAGFGCEDSSPLRMSRGLLED